MYEMRPEVRKKRRSIRYGVSGPSSMPMLSPDQFGEENTELTSSTSELVSGDGD